MTSRTMTLTSLGIAVGLAALGALFVSCDKTDPTADTDSTITVTSSPSTISFEPASTTASTRIDALVLDEDGQPLNRIGVRFTTDAGTLASNGRSVRTGSDGVASDTLTVGINDEDPTVTARSGNKTGEVTVTRAGENRKPVAHITVIPNTPTHKINVPFTLDASTSTDPDSSDTIEAWSWTFVPVDAHASSNLETLPVTFTTTGIVTVKLKVTDSQGLDSNLDSTTLTIIDHNPPTAAINALGSAPQVNVPFTVTGTGTADSGHTIVSYAWNMGDGTAEFTTQTASTPYTYATTGNKTITLKVNDNGDGTACLSTTPFTCHLSLTSTAATLNVTVAP